MSSTTELKQLNEARVSPERKAGARSTLKLAVDADGTITKFDGVTSNLRPKYGLARDITVNTAFLLLDFLPVYRKELEKRNDGITTDGPALNQYVIGVLSDVLRRASNVEIRVATLNPNTRKIEGIVRDSRLPIPVNHNSRTEKIRNNDILCDDSFITYFLAWVYRRLGREGATPILMGGGGHNNLFIKLVSLFGGRTATNKEEFERQLRDLGIVFRNP